MMVKIKTFTCPLRIFHAKEEIEDLDKRVNEFIKKNNVKKVVSVSDTCTTDNSGASIGLIRVVTYE